MSKPFIEQHEHRTIDDERDLGVIEPDDPIFNLGRNPLPKSPSRTLADALAHAERIRADLSDLIQPEAIAYDLVLLADEVRRLSALRARCGI